MATSVLAQEAQFPTNGKVTFRVQYSFGTTSSTWHRQFLSPDDREVALRTEVDNFAKNFNNHGQRINAIKDFCGNHSSDDVIRMGRYLGDQFMNGYDYEKLEGNHKGEKLTSADIWKGYHNRITSNGGRQKYGTAGDHTLAIAEFLQACGIDKDQISIERFQTNKGAHDVVNVVMPDGQLYSLNYSELYNTDYNPWFSAGLENSRFASGIKHTRYDAETGTVTDARMTELGHILMAVTGGRIDDPNYIPELLQLEANYGVISGGAYMANTARGEFVRGVKFAYDQRPIKWLHLKAGLTYAHSQIAAGNFSSLADQGLHTGTSQHIIFMQFRGTIDIPKLQLLKKADHKLYLDTNLDISAALALMWTDVKGVGGDLEFGHDQFNVTTAETYLVYRNNKMEARLGGGVETSIAGSKKLTETSGESANGMFPFPFMRGHFVKAEFTLKGDRLDIKAGAKLYFFSYGLDQNYYLQFLDKKRFLLFTLGFYNHTNRAGVNYPYINAELKKEFQINKVGRFGVGVAAQSAVQKDPNYGVMLNLSYTPDFTDHKKPKPTTGRDKWRLRRQKDGKSTGNR